MFVLIDTFQLERDNRIMYAVDHGRQKTFGSLVEFSPNLDKAKKFETIEQCKEFIADSYHGEDLITAIA